jgi:hypothetical protein
MFGAMSVAELLPSLLAASGTEPAGGAAIGQILIANAFAIAASGALAWLVLGHRSGRVPYLGRAAAVTERASGLPGWAALPSAIASVSLLVALLGMYWDISLHIDVGRDSGPLANPAHYLILAGLFGIFCSGFIAMALPLERPSPTTVRINRGWYAPLGGVLITVCAFFSLLGFPLDDFWHRLFGQDVTLWGPTHLMLIGGASLTLVGQAVLLVEGMRARERTGGRGSPALVVRLRRAGLMGGLLIGLSTFQAEFDFGVPQFQMVFEPILIALAAGVALVCARIWIGPGGALAATAFFLLIRGGIALVVAGAFGETLPHMPLYVAEAACVELAGLFLARRPLALAAASGLAIGTVGFAAEYGWSQVAMPLPWTGALLPDALLLAILAATAGAIAGALLALSLKQSLPGRSLTRGLALASLALVMALVANGLVTTAPQGLRASVRLSEVSARPDREVSVTARISPASVAEDARWLTITSWQGGGLVVDRLRSIGEGVYRSTEPIPVSGEWKTTLRLQTGRTTAAVPIYLPADRAIPAPAVAASSRFQRPFVTDKRILQRETKREVPGALTTLAPLLVLSLALALLTILALGLARLGRAQEASEAPRWETGGVRRSRSPRLKAPA